MQRALFPALALFAASLPAGAEMAFNPADLLSTRDTALAGAMLACDLGVRDPDAADALLTGAGWTKAEDEGSWGYASENLTVMMWTVPGFCMVEDAEAGTTAFSDTLLGLANIPPDIGTDADGCTTYTYDNGVIATLNGPGNDPLCTSDTGAALRFSLPN
ncbi:MAG: hypothetical protein U1E06_24970 [Tabrizicola sp.]|nr:hypothetical protein [Tabrizicola sp.]